jgi:hypothetical protein
MILVTVLAYDSVTRALPHYLLAYLFCLGRTTNIMQIGIVTDSPFHRQQFSKTWLLFLCATLLGAYLTAQGNPNFSEKWYYGSLAVLFCLNYALFAYRVVTRMAEILGLPIFTLPKPKG